jgi:5-methylcytosine-specific restriction protein A
MATYLLAWNPKRAYWDDIGEMSDTVQNGGTVETRWSCSNSKSIQTDDRVFFIKLGVPPKGIFASGHVIRGSYEDLHWVNERAEQGENCRFVRVRFDRLLDPVHDKILPRELLNSPPFNSMHWDTQSSGIRIADEVAIELEKLWLQYSEITKFTLPDEVGYDENEYHEGALRQVRVNAYERNSAARQKCIDIHGSRCKVCDFHFGDFYGKEMDDYIHVHHLTLLSEIGEAYVVNPETDLVPVCANCHAVIHRKKPPYSLEDVRSMIQQGKKR